jgi:hypothetical protein
MTHSGCARGPHAAGYGAYLLLAVGGCGWLVGGQPDEILRLRPPFFIVANGLFWPSLLEKPAAKSVGDDVEVDAGGDFPAFCHHPSWMMG